MRQRFGCVPLSAGNGKNLKRMALKSNERTSGGTQACVSVQKSDFCRYTSEGKPQRLPMLISSTLKHAIPLIPICWYLKRRHGTALMRQKTDGSVSCIKRLITIGEND